MSTLNRIKVKNFDSLLRIAGKTCNPSNKGVMLVNRCRMFRQDIDKSVNVISMARTLGIDVGINHRDKEK